MVSMMDLWKTEDSEGNTLSDKESEARFINWYNDVVEERMAMLEVEQAYKKRVKELEDGLSDLLNGFEDVEREVKYLRNKYEPSGDGDIYQEPYNVVFKERENLKEDEVRARKIIQRLKDENSSLKTYAKQTNGRCTGSSVDDRESAVLQYDYTDIESGHSPSTEFSQFSESPRFADVSNSPSYTAQVGLKSKASTDNRKNVFHNQGGDVTLLTNRKVRASIAHDKNGHVPFENKQPRVYTRKNIHTYRNEVRALINERLQIEDGLTTESFAKARNKNATRRSNGSYGGNLNNRDHSLVKYRDVMATLEKGLVVITSSERAESLEAENKKLKVQMKELEKDKNALLDRLSGVQHYDTDIRHASDNTSTDFSIEKTYYSKRRQDPARLPKLINATNAFMRHRHPRQSSPVSFPSIESSRSTTNNQRHVTVNKSSVRSNVYSNGYSEMFRKHNNN